VNILKEPIGDKFKREVIKADYQVTNAMPFFNNTLVPFHAVKDAREHMRQMDVACTRVDIVAHSMGGILTRLYMQNNFDSEHQFFRPDNFNGGDINRLITINTPHMGPP